MITEKLREQYGVLLIDEQDARAQTILKILQGAGYRPLYAHRLGDAINQIQNRPPHLILIHKNHEQSDLNSTFTHLRERLPESHFIVLSSASGLATVWREMGEKIYDCQISPPLHPRQLVAAIDRAVERDSFMYQVEELNEKLAAKPPPPAPPTPAEKLHLAITELKNEAAEIASVVRKVEATERITLEQDDEVTSDVSEFVQGVLSSQSMDFVSDGASSTFTGIFDRFCQTRGLDDLVDEGVKAIAQVCGGVGVCFLRYYPNRRCLAVSSAHNIADHLWRGVGINLSDEPDFKVDDLARPEHISSLTEMGITMTGRREQWAHPLVIRGEVFGLFMVFKTPDQLLMKNLKPVLNLIDERGQLLDLRSYIHRVEEMDTSVQVLTRNKILARLQGEIVRARRIHWPVSLLLISLDQHRQILTSYGIGEANLALRSLAKIIAPRSRVNDSLGRLGDEDLALVLPHTSLQGGIIKAEKLRRLVMAADFSKLFPRFPKLSISVGVGEYPSCCRDADDLVTITDEALWHVKSSGRNKVFVAQVTPGFKPDFQVAGG